MAIQLTSNTATEAELNEALEHHGVTPVKAEEPKTEEQPVVEKTDKEEPKTTEDAPGEGDKHSENAPEEGKEPDAEPKTKTQEGEEPAGEGDKPKSKGGLKSKLETQTAEINRLREKLSEEKGDRRDLERELQEANEKLAAMQKPEAKEEEPKPLERPKRPKLSDFDFDQEKFDAALDQYEADKDAYTEQQFSKKLEETVAKVTTKVAADNQLSEFHQKVADGAKAIPDYNDTLAEIPEDMEFLLDRTVGTGKEMKPTPAANAATYYLQKVSKNPAAVMHFLMRDGIDNDGAENDRLAGLTPMEVGIELAIIERGLSATKVSPKGTSDEPKEQTKTTTTAKTETKPKKAPVDPIDPVGSRQHSPVIDFRTELEKAAEAGDTKRWLELRAQEKWERGKRARTA